ncbi:MAG: bifunctional aconitate hydratase 2/2-methylisocitrate dehydratase [gamma proteobacterium symbiont of Bathyaustriella thionipta]|nr:bifunctional aconitate hydratase 2/2-methylisocitrate dehydratase [gamma proteobacterium symbiont of Bathyaustriella thionipta]MCU7950780.1 bifunctional aconitate hydratase 2/2-methylisocitrate dehydratase [gamma proteobacterium symbiont of Bathyaustriella thionipta]MCU7953138.1 bifunctional aconitate hydratase 2/2-methylisocitrate dehydratase [gamma proteobacterium symbiont of Bathyaustriella thionipta]MCU7957292.1 bifunctional aconitate hydratase 2/2-methylisocitrate dehydratase [gamma prot
MLNEYRNHASQRAQQNLPPLPLDTQQTSQLLDLLIQPPAGEEAFLLDLFINRIPPGVDDAAKVKADFLKSIVTGQQSCSSISAEKATEILGTMGGGYNIEPLVELLDNDALAPIAVTALSSSLLIADAWHSIMEKAKNNAFAQQVVDSWAAGEWFTRRDKLAESITVTVLKIPGETNTDDLSPATDAWSRPDIPLHAQSMLVTKMPDALSTIEELKKKGHSIAYVGDVVGTGSSRKSAINSVLWHMGEDIPFVPNKRQGGVVLGGKIAPIFFNTAEDSGALPIECDVSALHTGDVITIKPYAGEITDAQGNVISTFDLSPNTLADEVQAGGRIPLIIGRGLTDKTRESLGLEPTNIFIRPIAAADTGKGYTLAQKMVGKACGVEGIRPGTYCEPRISTVGSQDTTGAMTRDELKELACMGFASDLVMQSFCHTAAYPKPVDVKLQGSLPGFMTQRGGVSLRPGDGIIHSWLNRMLLPDQVGTGGDSHTRFPLGISFPAGSGLVAFASAMGVMPLDMSESVLVRFKGTLQPGITLRDLVNAIPWQAIQDGKLTVDKAGKINVFNGRILEIEGLPDLKVEQAFELADASAERSANGCSVRLNKEPVIEYLTSNITLLSWMIREGYQDAKTLQRRIDAMQAWLNDPQLLEPDSDAEYADIVEIDLDTIKEPILACPNDPDDVKLLSELAGQKIEEVFIGSCMTNIGHYRATAKVLESHLDGGGGAIPTRLWIAPPTKMDEKELISEGVFSIYGRAGARTELPGCSLCMGNQARVADESNVVSTSTRNFPNRLGKDAKVFLASAELSAVVATLGKLPNSAEYQEAVKALDTDKTDIYRYLNFNEMADYH